MAFRKNPSQQLSLDDRFVRLSPRVQKLIEGEDAWPHIFATVVFPAINEERFSVLYSDDPATRPNTPVNFIVGALLLKEFQQLTQTELYESILCDVRYQYALHTTSYEEQPVSDRTFSRFRRRLYDYEIRTGIDLLKEEIESLSEVIAEFMNLRNNIKRMDSMMVASRCKAMSRLEIIYTCVANMIRLLDKLEMESLIPEGMKHYLDKDDRNQVIYHAKGEESFSRLDRVIQDAEQLRNTLDEIIFGDHSEYQLLLRVLEEQAKYDESGNIIARDDKEISSDSLQNPSDPDATYRKKAGKSYKGYVGNVVETVGEDGDSVISSLQYEKNNYSDTAFMTDYLDQQPDCPEGESETVINDGAFVSDEIMKIADEKNIQLIPTAMTGKLPNEILADFELTEKETAVVKCPMGYEPSRQTFSEKTETIRAKFEKSCCQSCPNRDQCKADEQKKSFVVKVPVKSVHRARQMKKMRTEDYRVLSRKRNAIEGVVSVLRRRYRIDEIPVTGYLRSKVFFTLKVGAYNLGKLFRHCRRSLVSCAQNQEIA